MVEVTKLRPATGTDEMDERTKSLHRALAREMGPSIKRYVEDALTPLVRRLEALEQRRTMTYCGVLELVAVLFGGRRDDPRWLLVDRRQIIDRRTTGKHAGQSVADDHEIGAAAMTLLSTRTATEGKLHLHAEETGPVAATPGSQVAAMPLADKRRAGVDDLLRRADRPGARLLPATPRGGIQARAAERNASTAASGQSAKGFS